MGEYAELITKYKNLSFEENQKETINIFPKKQGKIVFSHQNVITMPSRKTLVIFTTNGENSSNANLIKKFDKSLDANVISISDIVEMYSSKSHFSEVVNEVFEEEVITSLEDGFVTVIDSTYTDILKRAIVLKAFEKYYDNAIDITIDMSFMGKGKMLYGMLSSICKLKEDRKNKFNLGVDINYIIPYHLEDKLKIRVNKKD